MREHWQGLFGRFYPVCWLVDCLHWQFFTVTVSKLVKVTIETSQPFSFLCLEDNYWYKYRSNSTVRHKSKVQVRLLETDVIIYMEIKSAALLWTAFLLNGMLKHKNILQTECLLVLVSLLDFLVAVIMRFAAFRNGCCLLYTMWRHHSQSCEESIPAYILFMKVCLFDFNHSKAWRKILVELVTQRPSWNLVLCMTYYYYYYLVVIGSRSIHGNLMWSVFDFQSDS